MNAVLQHTPMGGALTGFEPLDATLAPRDPPVLTKQNPLKFAAEVPVAVASFGDGREQGLQRGPGKKTEVIGRTVSPGGMPIESQVIAPQFVTVALSRAFTGAGFRLTPEPQADLVVTGTLLKYWVQGKRSYFTAMDVTAVVEAEISVGPPSNSGALFKKTFQGTATGQPVPATGRVRPSDVRPRWEGLLDGALVQLLEAFFSDPEVQQVFRLRAGKRPADQKAK